MEIIKGTYGTCYIQDNHEGLEELIKKKERYHVTITDIPYNNKKKRCSGMNDSKKPRQVDSYDDNFTPQEYTQLRKTWFQLNKQLSDYIVFFCGKKNLGFWQSYVKKFEEQWGIWHFTNSPSRGTFSKFLRFEPILFYGDYSDYEKKYDGDFFYYDYYINNGFMALDEFSTMNATKLVNPDPKYEIKHPHSKPHQLIHDLILRLKPNSVLDPWVGSGMTIRICEMYKIRWKAYEINPKYIPDIEWNIRVGQANPQKRWYCNQTLLNTLKKLQLKK